MQNAELAVTPVLHFLLLRLSFWRPTRYHSVF